MFLDDFHTVTDDRLCITAEQASRFAKCIAGDYNPIHDPDARRFCVPGDLLFALVMARFGLAQRMTFHFKGMVGDSVPLCFAQHGDTVSVTDHHGKVYLEVERGGDITHDAGVIEAFTRRYVAFSGRNFPHYLKPLMEEQGVMFNPQRPLVIYDSMGFSLSRLDVAEAGVAFTGATLDVIGKRGDALLQFQMTDADTVIGHGSKKLVVSGLREYDPPVMDAFVEQFMSLKAHSATTG
ncbi:DUF3581 family protein [Chromohalobacter israelensis]|uniref:DUF3581 family protein n=1 Tax=Chromohalobacter israelensis TaxID=141390 RepID=UPI000550367A|nr:MULTISPECIES: DUF3581 family protein [Chromohalobacter]MBZ5874763.1 DUF3581 domain-containing protein [Chromohalobacter salexigens]MDF9433568.1 DUF3581 domain-containing protein [Chromohalobacter israelensis]